MKKSSLRAHKVNRTDFVSYQTPLPAYREAFTYLISVVKMEKLASVFIHLLMGMTRSSHCQRGIHVHVVTGQIQTDKSLE